jgi:predicted 2-oxoglutarate/Fe(II)-dependent dioxygenase YbiX
MQKQLVLEYRAALTPNQIDKIRARVVLDNTQANYEYSDIVRVQSTTVNLTKLLHDRFANIIKDANKHFKFELYDVNKHITLYSKYPVGGKIGKHADVSEAGMLTDGMNKLTLVACLSPADQGGITKFYFNDVVGYNADAISADDDYDERYTVNMQAGDIIVFPSYVQHEISAVEKGVRETLTIVCRGDAFK